jgi:hypothetical protein
LDVVKHSVANAIFLFNSWLVATGANAVSSDLLDSLPALLLLLVPLNIIYGHIVCDLNCYNAFQRKSLYINNAFIEYGY